MRKQLPKKTPVGVMISRTTVDAGVFDPWLEEEVDSASSAAGGLL